MMDNIVPKKPKITQQRVCLVRKSASVSRRETRAVFIFPQGIHRHNPLPSEECLDRTMVLNLP